jgi:DNA-binding response OmpR family regulator
MALVLVVDDDEPTRGVLDALLRFEGHEVLLAANGKQALFFIKERNPDIVVSDVRMPGLGGVDLCREVRRNPVLRDTYILLATGYDTPDTRTEGIAAGADDYIGKPVKADELHARVRMGVRIRGHLREIADLKRKIGQAEKAGLELERFRGSVEKMRGDITAGLGTLLDGARRGLEASRQGDLKTSYASLERLCAGLEEMRGRVAPREGS